MFVNANQAIRGGAPDRETPVDGKDIPRQNVVPDLKRKVVFLGGVLLESQIEQIERESKSGVQYAADALQRAVLKGLVLYPDLDVHLVNVPFIGSYPETYKQLWFPAISDILYGKVPVSGMGFFNLLLVRNHFRKRSAIRGLVPLVQGARNCVIVVYSAHLPFVRAALACRKVNPDVQVCVILPDLIEFMGEYTGLRKFLVQKMSVAFRKLVSQIDFFVVLTPHMAEELGIERDRHVVIEGIHDPEPNAPDLSWSQESGPIFIYTGTLAKRYGILDLLEAFSQIASPAARLWICGFGDAEPAVMELARQDARVTFHGRVPRAEALALQARAHVMVNPRRPEGEFTRYSFPSKTMEYLASGRPVIMHWLSGIPEEYRPFLIAPDEGDVRGLAAAMQRVAALPEAELRRMGAAGRAFVLTQKTPRVQVGKMLAGLFPGWLGTPAGGD